jgi:hypothetical protein
VSLATDFLAVLDKFRAAVASHVNSGQLVTIDNHIDTLASVADKDVEAADEKAKAVLGELYTALNGSTAEPAPAPVEAPAAPVEEPAPAAPVAEAPVETSAPDAPAAS